MKRYAYNHFRLVESVESQGLYDNSVAFIEDSEVKEVDQFLKFRKAEDLLDGYL